MEKKAKAEAKRLRRVKRKEKGDENGSSDPENPESIELDNELSEPDTTG